ncbi:MAG TPA: dihydrolipoyllysine-residue acetyltransferase [Candidatus Baltobacteraceae bacterium]|jgi:pyruvate dehydrogenase E2 component (dihydrolipoamide acetyltransferase)|nr:dihydrolipoyllysine-residue acetyltransferase [Candidatus Baltobacteraceae bacterium]
MEVLVPDIGDFKDVPVIEILVKPGDRVKKDDSLIALESDKATMEVPSPQEGTVEELKVNVGDKVSQGSVILTLAQDGAAASAGNGAASTSDRSAAPAEAQAPASGKNAVETKPALETIEMTVPDIGDFKDVPVIEVFVKPGDRIEKDASLIALESEKATMEVPATAAGTVRDVKVKAGDRVSRGAVIAVIEGSAGPGAVRAAQDDGSPSIPQGPSMPQDDKGPSIPRDDKVVQDAASPSIPQGPSIPQDDKGPSIPQDDKGPSIPQDDKIVHASPSIRRFARELGVDLQRVQASGPNRRVTREDVQQFVKRSLQNGSASPAAAGTGLQIAPWPKIDFAQYGEIERKPLSRIKKISGANLQRNWITIPHVTQNDDADVTALEEFRVQLNAELAKSNVKITMLAFLIAASIAALKKYPEFNSSLDGDELVYKKYYNIGFAADTPGGLVVPVIKNADSKGVAEIAAETAQLAAKAREGKLSASDMQGGTFTISSLGSIGGTYFTPIINAPEVAILGACRAETRPVWNGTAFVPRLIQPLSLSYDHRVIDGAAAARFVAFLRTVLSDLRRALL